MRTSFPCSRILKKIDRPKNYEEEWWGEPAIALRNFGGGEVQASVTGALRGGD